jgi:hypothetical protein
MIGTCKFCATDEYTDFDSASGVALCNGPGHTGERMWEPESERPTASSARSDRNDRSDSIAAELGLYDDLLDCLRLGEWAETGVVEHRYGTAHPSKYQSMIDRWGHCAQGPRRYSVTTYIGSTLGTLCRGATVTHRSGAATGFFQYNPVIGFWTLQPIQPQMVERSWATEAVELGHQPGDWPLLGCTSALLA